MFIDGVQLGFGFGIGLSVFCVCASLLFLVLVVIFGWCGQWHRVNVPIDDKESGNDE